MGIIWVENCETIDNNDVMEIKDVMGFEVRMPERDQQNKFVDGSTKYSDGIITNKRRRDSGTKGNFGGLHHRDEQQNAMHKDKKAKVVLDDDLAQAGETTEEEPMVEDDLEEGRAIFDRLRRLQGRTDGALIDDRVEESDQNAEGDEPSADELEEIEKEEKEIEERKEQERSFYSDRGKMGRRGKGRWWRG